MVWQYRVFQFFFGIINRNMKETRPELIQGAGSLEGAVSILEKQNSRRPLFVTGPRVGKSEAFTGLVAGAAEKDINAVVFSEVKADPSISQIEEIVKLYKENECDAILAVGGGSNMDASKAVAARIARPGKTLKQLGGVLKVRKKTPFLIAVPTTAGTGSECTVAAVVTDDSASHKYAINDPVLCPDAAILDPLLTVSLPQNLTAYTGMDALTHAVEAYLNRRYHRRDTAQLAAESVRSIFKALPAVYADGTDVAAREEMLAASYKAGLAFTVACVGNVHAIAHTMGGLYHVQHGLANAIVLPFVLDEYRNTSVKELAELADFAGLAGTTQEEKADAFIEGVRELNRKLGIPAGCADIKEGDIEKMAGWAAAEANPLYPCPVIFDKKHFADVIKKIRTAGL